MRAGSPMYDPSVSEPDSPAPSRSGSQHTLETAPSRSKRYASTFDGDEDEQDENVKPRAGKRSKAGVKGAQSSSAALAGNSAKTNAEKEQRKEARMIRNRNAAQASRDRKKEHTQMLENRVAELTAQLEMANAAAAYQRTAAPASPPCSTHIATHDFAAPRSPSVLSVASSHPSLGVDILELEDENDTLRSQLHLEQLETARLRSRLEALEDRFIGLEQLIRPASATPVTSSALLSHTQPQSTPFEPTFSYDASSLLPSLPITSSSTDSSLPSNAVTTLPATEPTLEAKPTSATMELATAVHNQPQDSLSLSAAEAVSEHLVLPANAISNLGTPEQRDSATLPALSCSSSSSSSVSSSVHGSPVQHLETTFGSTGGNANLDQDVWREWAHGLSVLKGGEGPVKASEEEDDPSMEFLDMDYLHDAPVAILC